MQGLRRDPMMSKLYLKLLLLSLGQTGIQLRRFLRSTRIEDDVVVNVDACAGPLAEIERLGRHSSQLSTSAAPPERPVSVE
jgi:hypothetical protein